MLEVKSAIQGLASVERPGVRMEELPGFTLTQVAGDVTVLKKTLGKVPSAIGVAQQAGDALVMRVGPKQVWIIGKAPARTDGLYLTPLSSSRCRISLSGVRARHVLAACAIIDFEASAFKAGQYVMTGIHHTPVLIHCVGDDTFHIYAMRTFARAVWEWLEDIIAGLDT